MVKEEAATTTAELNQQSGDSLLTLRRRAHLIFSLISSPHCFFFIDGGCRRRPNMRFSEPRNSRARAHLAPSTKKTKSTKQTKNIDPCRRANPLVAVCLLACSLALMNLKQSDGSLAVF